jgi:pSer/pThr/pTyr-binding forkhead associated (FHA) protein
LTKQQDKSPDARLSTLPTAPDTDDSKETRGSRTAHADRLGPNSIALYAEGFSEPIIFEVMQQVIIGRHIPNNASQPSLDLTAYQAYEKGVSRVHARIRRVETGLLVEDMGSSNGSWLNGVRLTPYSPRPLAPGDKLLFARMPLEVYFRTETKITVEAPTTAILGDSGPAEAGSEDIKSLLITAVIKEGEPTKETVSADSAPAESAKPGAQPVSRYLGKVSFDAKQINGDLNTLAQEVVKRLAGLEGCDVKVSVEIEAQTAGSFDEELRRSISESTQKLKFSKSDFLST